MDNIARPHPLIHGNRHQLAGRLPRMRGYNDNSPAAITARTNFLDDNMPGESHYDPSPSEVYEVKDFLMSVKPHLPLELVDMVIDAAEYWPCTVTSLSRKVTVPDFTDFQPPMPGREQQNPKRGREDVLLFTTREMGSFDATDHAARRKRLTASKQNTQAPPEQTSGLQFHVKWLTSGISSFLGIGQGAAPGVDSPQSSLHESSSTLVQASPPLPQTSEPDMRPPSNPEATLRPEKQAPPPEVTQAPNPSSRSALAVMPSSRSNLAVIPSSRSALAVMDSLRAQGALPQRGVTYDDIATAPMGQATFDLGSQTLPEVTEKPANIIQYNPRGRFCRKIVFLFSSKDQGWGGSPEHHGTHEGSYTWFTALRKTPEEYESRKSMDKLDRADQFFHEYCMPGPYMLQNNVTASGQYANYRIVWSRDDQPEDDNGLSAQARTDGSAANSEYLSPFKQALKDQGRGYDTADGRFVRELNWEDRIEIWASARFGGWANHVAGFTVKLYWAV